MFLTSYALGPIGFLFLLICFPFTISLVALYMGSRMWTMPGNGCNNSPIVLHRLCVGSWILRDIWVVCLLFLSRTVLAPILFSKPELLVNIFICSILLYGFDGSVSVSDYLCLKSWLPVSVEQCQSIWMFWLCFSLHPCCNRKAF